MKLFAATAGLCFAMSATAETYLCIGEHAATVSHKDGTVTGSDSFPSAERFLVDEHGLRTFGNDTPWLDKCNLIDGRPVFCERANGMWGGLFAMDDKQLFTLIGARLREDGTVVDFTVKGKCSVLN